MSVPSHQLYMYVWLTIRKLSQQGPYLDPRNWGEAMSPYCFKTHDQPEPKHQGGTQSCPNPLTGHRPGRLSPRRTIVLTQSPHGRRRVAYLTSLCRNRPRIQSAHQYFPTPTPPHMWTSGAKKEIQITNNQWMVKSRLPDHLTTMAVMSHQRPVLERATATLNMSSQPKTHPRARPT